jgi:UDP-N-acetylglucosamine acyltransferase
VSIHPTAIVEPGASIGEGVEIGAFSYIGPHVTLGDGCRIYHHATVEGHTTLGQRCIVFPQACVGLAPQDVKYRGEKTYLVIGNDNVIRECVTVHPGTENGGGTTRIGNGNLLLIGAHVAHDCTIGNNCVFANYVQLAGHVHVEDNVNMGGHSAVHHFVTVGKHAFIGGMTRISADAPPFMVVVAARGTRSEIRMVNGIGLQRSGYSHEDIAELKKAFMKLYSRKARMDGSPIRNRVKSLLQTENINPHLEYLCQFLMRSFDYGRNGRYLESLRQDPVHRSSWKAGKAFTLSVSIVGKGKVEKVLSPHGQTAHEVCKLIASPAPGWRFAEWNGSLSGQSNPENVVLDADKYVTAVFTNGSST